MPAGVLWGTRAYATDGQRHTKLTKVFWFFFSKKNVLPFFFCFFFFSFSFSFAHAQVWGLPDLMRGLAQVKSASAQFTERQTMAMLDAPLVTAGTLSYVAPDWMRKVTFSPPEQFVLDGARVTMTGADGQVHVFSLNEDPRIGGLTEGILATLAGNLPALERVYRVQFSGSPASWTLLLRPRDPQLSRFIAWIRITGSQNRITAIGTRSGNGDGSEMRVTETVGDAQ
jgi:outer membrane lipoprotein-sorting protein